MPDAPLTDGGYLLILEQQNGPSVRMRIETRSRLRIHGFALRADDGSMELNFYPARAALFLNVYEQYVRIPNRAVHATLPMDPPPFHPVV